MMKRLLSSLVVILVISALMASLVACGGNSTKTDSTTVTAITTTPATSTVAEKKDPVNISFFIANSWAKDPLKAAVKNYETSSSNTVAFDIIPDDQWQNLIKVKLAAGELSDVAAVQAPEQYLAFTGLEPLDGPWLGNVIDAIKPIITRKSDNAVVRAPYGATNLEAVIYNKAAMAKAGVTLPIKTYTDLLAACEKLKAAGITPFYLPNKSGWEAEMIPIIGGVGMPNAATVIENLKANKLKPSDSPEYMDLVKRVLALKEKGYINKDFNSFSYDNGMDPVVQGKCAMYAMGTFVWGSFSQYTEDQQKALGMMPITFFDDFISVTAGMNVNSFCIPATSKHIPEAKELINFLLQPDVEKTIAGVGGSPYKNVELQANPWIDELNSYVAAGIPLTADFLYGSDGYLTDWGNGGAVWQSVFAGKSTKSALNDWYNNYYDINKAKKTPGFEEKLK